MLTRSQRLTESRFGHHRTSVWAFKAKSTAGWGAEQKHNSSQHLDITAASRLQWGQAWEIWRCSKLYWLQQLNTNGCSSLWGSFSLHSCCHVQTSQWCSQWLICDDGNALLSCGWCLRKYNPRRAKDHPGEFLSFLSFVLFSFCIVSTNPRDAHLALSTWGRYHLGSYCSRNKKEKTPKQATDACFSKKHPDYLISQGWIFFWMLLQKFSVN